MAVKKQLRRRKTKGEGRPAAQQFISAEPSHEALEGNTQFFPPGPKPQTKLTVSTPGDPQEQEADKMADKVVQRASIDSHTLDQRDDRVGIATKKEGGAAPAPGAGAAVRPVSKGGGSTLPTNTAAEMSGSFGYDFGKVRIHTGTEAQAAAAQLQAQAFTYGGEIYFNKDKYNPGTKEGKWLLAHELTHVVQQQGQELSIVQKKDVPEISTPVPKKMKTNTDATGAVVDASGKVGKVKVIILPDIIGEVPPGKSAMTNVSYVAGGPSYESKGDKISKIIGKATLEITIQTTYKPGADTKSTSVYGRGTTKKDKKAGHTTLRFHEGSHGSFVFSYLAKHKVPSFGGAVGQTVDKFVAAGDKYTEKVAEYMAKLDAANNKAVDCTGTKDAACTP
ncbi:DUF4157 domain-containing protein [Chitinophaga sp.]|uniref:eCIS core domain-containing protein n=1 Tax=Chitinophaga sp. TaxID=1869181 RepID=UPI002F942B05